MNFKDDNLPSEEEVALQAAKLWTVMGSVGMTFNADPEALTEGQLVGAYALLDFVQKFAEDTKQKFRSRLLEIATKNGEKNEKGTFKVLIEGTTVLAENRTAALPSDEPLKELLKKANVKLDDCYDTIKVLQVNPSKLEYLVDGGFLQAEDVIACKKTSVALVVHASAAVKKVLTEVRKGFKKIKAKPVPLNPDLPVE